MRLLILTQYYPPEIGAPQNRLHELAIRLKSTGMEVEVLTALPNYPGREILENYKNGRNREEVIDGISVHRSGIYVSRSNGIVKRLLNYFSFVWTSYLRGKKLGKFDFLMVESPPLFLGYSAIWLSKKLKAKLIFNVSDLWPESAEKLGIVTNKYLLKLAYQLEAKCYKEAYLVTGQTQGIVNDIASRFPSKRIYYLPNGVDTSFYDSQKVLAGDFRERNGFKTTDFLIFYGGILGHAQGLEVVLNAANLLKDQRHVHFILQGTGPEQEQLLQLKANLDLKQVHFFEPVQKKEMPSIIKSIDVAIIPLKKLLLFEGAIPSKVYEALAMKKPLLLGVSGEAKRHFIDKAKAGLYFEPENHEDLAGQIISLVENPQECLIMGENARNYVSNNFDRDKIAKEFLAQLV
ncbi:MAG: glycosyltransferase family 4 protein [Crocinitomicaceae bacterium]|nr:glycosyltransferase family 4 protein [Crocinitomicaceae bacterium]